MRKRLLAILTVLSLTSCSSNITYADYVFGGLVSSSFDKIVKTGYYRQGEIEKFDYANGSITDFKASSIFRTYSDRYIDSVGEKRLLVIPVDFDAYPSSTLDKNALTYIRSSFFGDGSSNQYVSLSSFFDQSSGGRFHLKGHVANSWFRSPFSYSSLMNQTGSSNNKQTLTTIYKDAVDWFKATYPDFDLTPYYCNGVLPAYLVYSAPYSGEKSGAQNRDSFFWAYTINNPAPISWSAFSMMHLSGGKVDAHTYIHEASHLLGLTDYYSTYASSSIATPVSPLGRMDMMDCSLGDHNCFSKYILGWARPYVVSSSCEVTLHPSQGSNEFILVSPSWNGLPYDEYLLLEYYTPYSLNYVDSAYRSDETLRLFGSSGIKVYHVDARLGVYSAPARFNGYLSHSSTINDGNYLNFHASNSITYPGSGDVDTSQCLIQLLDKSSGSASLKPSYVASTYIKDIKCSDGSIFHLRDSLFQAGDSFGVSSFKDLKFHNGASTSFSFKVDELTPGYATLSFTFA